MLDFSHLEMLDNCSLSVDAFRVYCYLRSLADEDLAVSQSHYAIGFNCFKASMPEGAKRDSYRTRAIKAVKELVDKKFVLVERVSEGNGAIVANKYQIIKH